MKLKMSSNLFSVIQPDMYWQFDGFMERLEEDANEWHNDDDNRYGKYIHEEGQMPLFNEADNTVPFVDITELRVRNPEWQEGHYECNSWKACKIISEAWLDTFNERIKERGIKAKAKFTGIDRPREYNFAGDAAVFELSISLKEIERLFTMCRERSDFDAFLHKQYSSYDGFWSWMANNLDDWNVNTKWLDEYSKDWERSIWQALDFLMWDDEAGLDGKTDRELWSEDFRWHIEDDLVCNGAFENCLEFVPEEAEEAIA